MEVALFWIFAALMLGFGAAVIFLKSPVSSALSLVVSFLGLAALFLLLDAFFIGIIQVLVYAGAVMVLFLFIIMLLDLKTERARKFNIPAMIGGLMVVVGFIALLVKLLAGFDIAKPALARPVNDVAAVGMLLFSDYNLPFQIIGVLLLVATVGVVLLSRKELK
ncbi:NADH-quinone oxidoreductase subunit J [Terrimicrobium sacchariphilum]|jgi:NADH-quinone oxidoreductase subunit J|uniref:NADH-quinone oxidoreductase subunit J n=1 Tax=Terrimicrobium sacchariphilum TaxID=690879 RepID=A0A146G7K1_TERSA|nr:NADH-quinone oxidoreductase subunit J [Terrimicrobium sacchariphilum]GAT33481.1 NADH-quinone oxidoreductase subunit J [Terrimicrobium sacchariphilum]